MQWYYVTEGRREGPVEEDKLRELINSGVLKPTDLIWNETMGPAWKSAAEVFTFSTGGPPPIPPSPPTGAGPSDTGEEGRFHPSCTAPLAPAWRRMKTILFQPFSIAKWFVLGFSLWLATLGRLRGGSVPNAIFRMLGRHLRRGQCCVTFDMFPRMHVLAHWEAAPLLLVATCTLIFGLLLLIALLWLRSRGRFVFLDNVVNNRAEVSRPWQLFGPHGNSVFLWTLGFDLVCLLVAVPLLAVTLPLILSCIRGGILRPHILPGFLGLGSLWFLLAALRFYVGRFLEDFVVPIMYKFNLTAMAAWRRFFSILTPTLGHFVLYGVFYTLLEMAIAVVVLFLVIATCCVAGCVLALPYVGTVLLLPAFVFLRCYSLEYLARFGSQFRITGDSATAAPHPGHEVAKPFSG